MMNTPNKHCHGEENLMAILESLSKSDPLFIPAQVKRGNSAFGPFILNFLHLNPSIVFSMIPGPLFFSSN